RDPNERSATSAAPASSHALISGAPTESGSRARVGAGRTMPPVATTSREATMPRTVAEALRIAWIMGDLGPREGSSQTEDTTRFPNRNRIRFRFGKQEIKRLGDQRSRIVESRLIS